MSFDACFQTRSWYHYRKSFIQGPSVLLLVSSSVGETSWLLILTKIEKLVKCRVQTCIFFFFMPFLNVWQAAWQAAATQQLGSNQRVVNDLERARLIWLLPPLSHSPIRKLDRRHTQEDWEREITRPWKRVGGQGAESDDRKKAWSSNQSILSGLNISLGDKSQYFYAVFA
jgi:hypothetical protein